MDNEKKFHFTCAGCFNPSFSGFYLVYMHDGWYRNTSESPYYVWQYYRKENVWYDGEGNVIDKDDEGYLYWCELPEEVNAYMHNKEDQK